MRVAPRATYRVQLHAGFDFAAAAALVPYLANLGFSHLYCSPIMQAAPGSTHGYDVIDPTRVSEDLGGDAGLEALDDALRAHHMGMLLDIVPNHMCIGDPGNVWWWDVLRRGAASRFAPWFDIDWDAPGLGGRVLLPVLGEPLEWVLERGELQVTGTGDDAVLHYHDQCFPLAPGTRAARGAATRAVLDAQHYLLEPWRTGLRRVNYRRFFDIGTLAGVRQELPTVYEMTHRRALELVAAGTVDGLRIDHIDGLRDPAAYLERLHGDAGGAWLVIEKILAAGETLPMWPVDGTVGYEFAARVTQLMIDRHGCDVMTSLHAEATDDRRGFAAEAHAARLDALEQLLSAELDRLTRAAAAAGIAGARTELAELIAGMPVYRVYPRHWEPLAEAEERELDVAVTSASDSGMSRPMTLAALARVLLARGEVSAAATELRARAQQVSAAATAKGVEDTAFYRHVRLVALNEVGGDPATFGIDVDAFHDACELAAARTPRGLLATATHDTKRGEDARLRVAMLSEVPARWGDAVAAWRSLASRHRGERGPSANAEYLFYQTLVAAHPIDAERMTEYMGKAVREAKQETSWLDPDAAYEGDVEQFVRGMLADGAFMAGVAAFVAAMTPAWQAASLSQALLKLTCPGVADVYQGCELWDLTLVDPDNRRPVDYALRQRLLRGLDGTPAARVMARRDEGLPKLHLTRRALEVRSAHAAAFAAGSAYRRIAARGERARHAVVFARAAPDAAPEVITVALRLAFGLGGDWRDTEIDVPDGAWRNALTDDAVRPGTQRLAELLHVMPVALLERV